MLKKAAMFGLDARIALAIFGALSVISGAALYSAIEKAKLTQITTRITEMTKSMEAYILDTGTLPDVFTGPYDEILDPKELISSTKQGWKGPYSTEKVGDFNETCTGCVFEGFDMPYVGTYPSFRYTMQKTDNSKQSGTSDCTTGDNTCRLFISFNYLDTVTADKLDKHIDGENNDKTGRLRIHTSSNSAWHYVFYDTGIYIDSIK